MASSLIPLVAPLTPLCDNCQQRPRFSGHSYCGRTCASQAAQKSDAQGKSQAPQDPQADVCETCKVKPKYRETSGFTHPYCGRTCAAKSSTSTSKSLKSSKSSELGLNKNICLWCRRAPTSKAHFCCKTCALAAEAKGPILLEVPSQHETFKNVEDQFNKSWRHDDKLRPAVRRVYKVILSAASEATYSQYRTSVEAKGKFAAAGMYAGNENRRWHGTRRECTVGDDGESTLCSSTTCSLCSIIRTSYDVAKCKAGTSFERFGAGIYTSSTSSKSHDYARNGSKSPSKAILLNKVIVGNGYKLHRGNSALTSPPSGYDSVLGETGKELNYDELVIYRNDAIRPSFLVVYDA